MEEDNTINVGGEGYKVVLDNGPQESQEKRKGMEQVATWTFKDTCVENLLDVA